MIGILASLESLGRVGQCGSFHDRCRDLGTVRMNRGLEELKSVPVHLTWHVICRLSRLLGVSSEQLVTALSY
jgi:hypothetical protein